MKIRSWIHQYVLMLFTLTDVLGCTRVFWWDNPYEYIVGRTMDWMEQTHPEIVLYPPLPCTAPLPEAQETYGMIALTAYHEMTVDGLNTQGLAGHVLYLGATQYNAQPHESHALPSKDWLHFILQRYSSVENALQHAQEWCISPSTVATHPITIHLALEDRSGDSAILEYKNGFLTFFRGPQHTVLTNAPFYEEHLNKLASGIDQAMACETYENDRFVKAHYGLAHLIASPSKTDNHASIRRVLDSVSVHTDPCTTTYYHTLTNLTKGTFSFFDRLQGDRCELDLHTIDFSNLPEEGKTIYTSTNL